jgi:hypothetical protein
MKTMVLGLAAVFVAGLAALSANADPYILPGHPQAPDACGPGFYAPNCCGQWYGPNYCLRPCYPPFNGLLPSPPRPGNGDGTGNGNGNCAPGGPGCAAPGGPGCATPGIPAFPTHPFARSPRDFFMQDF